MMRLLKTERAKFYTAAGKWVKGAENHRSTYRGRSHFQHIVLTSMNFGMRFGEAIEIRWENVRTIRTSKGHSLLGLSGPPIIIETGG